METYYLDHLLVQEPYKYTVQRTVRGCGMGYRVCGNKPDGTRPKAAIVSRKAHQVMEFVALGGEHFCVAQVQIFLVIAYYQCCEEIDYFLWRMAEIVDSFVRKEHSGTPIKQIARANCWKT